jgi:hypothetical protein
MAITAVGSTKELINSQKDASDPFHGLVQVISLFSIDYAPSGTFSYQALDDDLFLEEVDLPTAKAIGLSGRFDLEGYPVFLQLSDDEYQNGNVPGGWPESTGQPWKEYKLGSLLWESFNADGSIIWTFGDLSSAGRSDFVMSKVAQNLEPLLPAGAILIDRDTRRGYNG